MAEIVGQTTTDKIRADAYERQLQILLLGEQEANLLYKKIVAAGKEKIDEEFGFLSKKQMASRRIARSECINHHRMLKIRKKYDLCEKIFEAVEHRLQNIANNEDQINDYKLYLVETIVDGLVRMFEETIHIRCLQKDEPFFNELIPLCVKSYRQFMQAQIGIDYPLSLSIASNMKLEKRVLKHQVGLQKGDEDKICIGGVILADATGNITFKATFDSRLSILKDISLPDIRATIWGPNQK